MSRNRLLLALLVAFIVAIAMLFLLEDEAETPTEDVPPGGALVGDPWTGRGNMGISQDEAAAFSRYQLFWFGPSYGGFNLQVILDASGSVSLVYGSCRLRSGPEPSCAAPLSFHNQSVCFVRPEQATNAYSGPPRTVRGEAIVMTRENAQFAHVGVGMWTGRTFLSISSSSPGFTAEGIISALQSFDGSIPPGAPMPAPDFSAC